MSETTTETTNAAVETRNFQAQTQKLLELMIHSVYANREVFLRELISNASDAIDKVRFLALTDASLTDGDSDFKIKLVPNADARTLTITDNGIGMSHDEVVEHIGTIAHSGSEAFASKLAEAKTADAPELIGRFGLGFYSAFMVADSVTLTTWKKGEETAVRWHSEGGGSYTVENIAPDSLPHGRGTSITLHLKPVDTEDTDAQDFANGFVLKQIVKKHSDFVAFPVVMDESRTEIDRDDEGKPVEGAEERTIIEENTLNSMKALWTRPVNDISDDDHAEFYRHLTHDWGTPSDRMHLRVEGMNEYTALMYVPERAPMDLYSREAKRGLSLYVKHVFISDDVRELMPEYLRFIRGLVDSPDLPLNVSREMVQQHRLIGSIRKHLAKKWLGHFAKQLTNDREAYEKFWTEFGAAIKEGFHYDAPNKAKIEKTVLFRTTKGDGWRSLAEIVEDMAEGQEDLFYLTGDSLETLKNAPQLEIFASKGVEVLLLADAIDEVLVGNAADLGGKALKSASRGDIDLDAFGEKSEDAEETKTEDSEALSPLLETLGKALEERVEKVQVSARLTDSAACLVTPENGITPQMAQMFKAMGQEMPASKRLLEINPSHPLVKKLVGVHEKDAADDRIATFGALLVDQAVLSEGGQLDNPHEFVRRMAEVMTAAL
ncbi:MAG: molecular chaperone HtpG [Myxococcales bacterium]|nr:molecular chaperone HtpG [Myxococcales bacterium]